MSENAMVQATTLPGCAWRLTTYKICGKAAYYNAEGPAIEKSRNCVRQHICSEHIEIAFVKWANSITRVFDSKGKLIGVEV